MDWVQAYTIIGVILTAIGILATLIVWSMNRIDSDVQASIRRLDGHATRIDQLYVMFVDLLKEKNKGK